VKAFDPLLAGLFRWTHDQNAARAHAYEDALVQGPARAASTAWSRAALALGGKGALSFGTLPSGDLVSVRRAEALRSALIIGASGAGKTRLLLHVLGTLLRDGVAAPSSSATAADGHVQFELVDPKYETYDVLGQTLAALWSELDEEGQASLTDAVRVIDWSPEAVTPFAPFDARGSITTPAYLAHLRTDIAIQSSPADYPEAVRQALFMLHRLLVTCRFPLNYRFVERLFFEAAYRARILERVADADIRAYFSSVESLVAPQTLRALLWRVQKDLSFPEIRLSEGLPPAALDHLAVRGAGCPIVLGNYSSQFLPASKGRERANHRVTDVLLRAPQRDTTRPGLLVLEEASALLAGRGELTEPLLTATRTLRSVGFGIWYCTQDLQNALPSPLVRMLQLNTRWWAVFQTLEEAEWVYPHVLATSHVGGPSDEAARHREFLRRMAGLPRRAFYLAAKGHPALPLQVPLVADPGTTLEPRQSAAELRAIFQREFARPCQVAAAVAEAAIQTWEAEVVDGGGIPPVSPGPPTTAAPSGPRVSNAAELIRHLLGATPTVEP